MDATFQVKSIKQNWAPPFKKEIEENNFTVSIGQNFEQFEGTSVFKLIKVAGTSALVEFRPDFTIKGHEHPKDRQVWIHGGEPKSFSYLWGKNGTTKVVSLKTAQS